MITINSMAAAASARNRAESFGTIDRANRVIAFRQRKGNDSNRKLFGSKRAVTLDKTDDSFFCRQEKIEKRLHICFGTIRRNRKTPIKQAFFAISKKAIRRTKKILRGRSATLKYTQFSDEPNFSNKTDADLGMDPTAPL